MCSSVSPLLFAEDTLYLLTSVTRFLHHELGVLHRDISKGNILFMPKGNTLPPSAVGSFEPAQQISTTSNDTEANSPGPSAHQSTAASPETAQYKHDSDLRISTTAPREATTEPKPKPRNYSFIKRALGQMYVTYPPSSISRLTPDSARTRGKLRCSSSISIAARILEVRRRGLRSTQLNKR
jgi:serine/threonine protein kinase